MRLARDQSELVLRASRADFVRMHDHPFLVGSPSLRKPAHAHLTAAIPLFDPATLDASPPVESLLDADLPMVLPIRKLQSNFPSMITVGRTANNDLTIPDVNVSKFHAWFRQGPAGVELVDAGSRNGTFVDDRRLPSSRGAGMAVIVGQVLRFGDLTFRYLDAATLWAAVQAR